ncbi:hypothetical protein L1987_60331 [Smallanthus sonchifolius]|uniref:Uncharacterized protein n=1 Tax=Smallanthus sonchifolius TaxID=185202 RepID=A0ACB9D7R2_9ASTR|nr:hypothetical protein L1987_60331 [Smallanthus sonchifolius]
MKLDGIPQKMGHFDADKFDESVMGISLPGRIIRSVIHMGSVSLRCIKNCKKDWESNQPMPFKGALPILTLLYVDYVKCNGMPVDRTVSPIEFWNLNRLQKRETLEISSGGFGKGDLLLYVDYVKCNGMKMDRTVSPIEFWNLNRLQKRETLEISSGGFGKGELIGMSKLHKWGLGVEDNEEPNIVKEVDEEDNEDQNIATDERDARLKSNKIEACKINRLKLGWETIGNIKDCGIFAMRHMEMFMGSSDKVFDCGFSLSEATKKNKSTRFRKDLCFTILWRMFYAIVDKHVLCLFDNVSDNVVFEWSK